MDSLADPQRGRDFVGHAAVQGFARWHLGRAVSSDRRAQFDRADASRRREANGRSRRLCVQLVVDHRLGHPGGRHCCRPSHGLFALGARPQLLEYAKARALLATNDRLYARDRIVTRYSGVDATLGLAFANTGWLYPLFGTMLGWLGVALTGSDTSSNVLFGSLQRITAEQLGLSPILMSAANSSGGVMGKMIDAQSIVVASTATRWYGHEGDILRYVFCTRSSWPPWWASSSRFRLTSGPSPPW